MGDRFFSLAALLRWMEGIRGAGGYPGEVGLSATGGSFPPEDLSRISIPVFLIRGTQDGSSTVEGTMRLYDMLVKAGNKNVKVNIIQLQARTSLYS